MPVLSRGKHRNPKKGACFMEYASLLAGERWSDHPACTHPLLAGLARLVNDCTTDEHRSRLAVLIPSVIGVTSDDPRIDVRIALRSALTAFPVVSAERQRVMGVSILTAERILEELDGDSTSEHSQWARTQDRSAMRWAERYVRDSRTSIKQFCKYAAPSTVQLAVSGIAQAVVPDPDQILYDLLATTVEECRSLTRAADELAQVGSRKASEAVLDP
ncbi:MAG: hypothetical protein ACRDT4_23770 [Micromonosporaceae bacterium]